MTEAYQPQKANHVALTPLSFLHRTADIYPDHPAVVYHDRHYTWAQSRDRCYQLASALKQAGIKRGDTVEIFDPAGNAIGRGLCNFDAEDCTKLIGCQGSDINKILNRNADEVVIHRNNLVIISR